MNRRGFLGLIGATVAGIALDKAVPLGRVYSFPTEIVPANVVASFTFNRRNFYFYEPAVIDQLKMNMVMNAWHDYYGYSILYPAIQMQKVIVRE